MKVALKIRGECHFVNHSYTDAIRVVTNTRHFYVVLVENNTHVTAVVIRKDKKIIASVEKRKKSDHYDKDTYFSLSWGIK